MVKNSIFFHFNHLRFIDTTDCKLSSAGFRGSQGARAPTKKGPPPCSRV